MRGKWFTLSKKKTFLIIALATCCLVFDKIQFYTIETIIRDSLQFLNTSSDLNKNLATLTINLRQDSLKYPYDFESVYKIITHLQNLKPKSIVVCMEPLDFIDSETEKIKIFNFLKSQSNIFINGSESRNNLTSFKKDPIFKEYSQLIDFDLPKDMNIDRKNRRAIITINQKGHSPLFDFTKQLGLKSYPPSHFKYTRDFWESKQAYIKNFRLNAFGNFQSSDLFNNRLQQDALQGKVVFIGTHDEFSYLSLPSVFNFLGSLHESNLRLHTTPLHHLLATLINFHSTGSYIRYFQKFDAMILIFIVLFILILLNIDSRKKLFIFLGLIPTILAFELLIYVIGDYYIDFSSAIALLIFIQYLAVPIILFGILKTQEQQKLQEIHNATIDTLLTVSERVAHDIRSPLSAVRLTASKAKFDNPEFKDIMHSSLARIDEIAEKILTKYKKIEPLLENVEVVPLINGLISEKKLLDDRIVYSFIYPENDKLFILGSALELKRVLSNILDNSIYALRNQEQALINLKIQLNKNYLNILASDNGPGIPAHILLSIGKNRVTTKDITLGNGIGILHSKRAIESMGGAFNVESGLDMGTRISISLKRPK